VSKGTNFRIIDGLEIHVLGVAFSPDGERLVTSGWNQTVNVWDIAE
jgi:WD40 repeat protein